MTHVITSLCLRDGGCSTVCPVECIVPGKPVEDWPLYYIDPDTCIDCGACVSECPFNAIFPQDEVPDAYTCKGEILSESLGTPGFNEASEWTDHFKKPVYLPATRTTEVGEVVDLTPAIAKNAEFFSSGPGYDAAK
jgi:ferredoxin